MRTYAEVKIPSDGLSGPELKALWGAYFRSRGECERNRLWEHYYGLVVWLAARFRFSQRDGLVSVGDLAQWGSLGLADAIRGFDGGRGVKFETYAVRRIWGAMCDGLRGFDVLGRGGRRAARRGDVGAVLLGGVKRFGDILGESLEPWNQVGVDGEVVRDGGEWDWLMRGRSREDRLILTLYFRSGWSQGEIAAFLGRSQSHVSQRIREGKALVRERLEARGDGG